MPGWLRPEEKQRILDALRKVGADLPCPRCGNEEFSLADGYVQEPLQPHPQDYIYGTTSIPCAVLICSRCGFLSFHALGVLGLLPKPVDDGL